MIRIDDAGWGSLIGGVLIGAYKTEGTDPDGPGKFTYAEIPVELFQGESFQKKEYFEGAGKAALQCLSALSADPKLDEILMCTGHVLDGAEQALLLAGYKVTRGKITGKLQELVENELVMELQYHGLGVDYKTVTDLDKKGLFWWKQVNWLKNGNSNSNTFSPTRAKLCKTGWATFNIWAMNPYSIAKEKAARFKAQRRRQYFND